jgi:hypothetical protein
MESIPGLRKPSYPVYTSVYSCKIYSPWRAYTTCEFFSFFPVIALQHIDDDILKHPLSVFSLQARQDLLVHDPTGERSLRGLQLEKEEIKVSRSS